MFKRTMLVLGASMMIVGCQSTKDLGGMDSSNATSMDNNFFRDTAVANMTEIQMAQDALNKSSNPQVKAFAQHMIDDHTMVGNQLASLAQSKGAMLPTKLDGPHMDMVTNLQSMSGTDYDKTYASDNVTAHEMTITEVTHESTTGNDPDVKQFAAKILPNLKMHLQVAQQLQSNLNSNNPTAPLNMMPGGTNMTGNSQGM